MILKDKKRCFTCDKSIKNDEKSVTLKFINAKEPFELYFHINHYILLYDWLENKIKIKKDYKFDKFSKMSIRERNEEEQIAINLGLGSEFKKDRSDYNNILIYESIEETLVNTKICPITKKLTPLWACVECLNQNCPKKEFIIQVHLTT